MTEGSEPIVPTKPSDLLEPPELATAPQRRKTDPLKQPDMAERVATGEELTSPEKLFRRLAANKKAIGAFLGAGATLLTTVAATYPKPWLIVLIGVLSNASGILVGGGSLMKSDDYERQKNAILKQREIM